MKRLLHVLILMCCVGSFAWLMSSCQSCSHKNHDELVEEEQVDYPVSIIPDRIATDLADQTVLYPVSEDFMREFSILADRYDGRHLTVKVDFPAEWGVRCIERLPEGKELWFMQSQNREWLYLVVTSGSGTQRILDVLPVAVNIAVQNQDELETELWHTLRESDGSFVVYKSYEWTRSLGEATRAEVEENPENYNRVSMVTERYMINEMGRFEYFEEPDTIEYEAVFFYYDRENKPEEWDEVMEIVQSYCEEKGIYFDEVYDHYDNVYIRDYEENDIIPMNLLPFIDTENAPAGMVMMKNGFDPQNVTFGSVEKLKVALIRYFKLGERPL